MTTSTPATSVVVPTSTPAPPPVPLTLREEVVQNIGLFEKSVSTSEVRYITRALRTTSSVRKKLELNGLRQIIKDVMHDGHLKELLLESFPKEEVMEVETPTPSKKVANLPEIDMYLSLLSLIYLFDSKLFEKGVEISIQLVKIIQQDYNKRSLDQLNAKIFYYYARFHEVLGKHEETRSILLASLRTATLRKDEELQATILNLLLRSYLESNLVEQADKLVSKTTFPESVGNNQHARYFYYLGRIKAIQLDYTESHKNLMQAIRKSPQSPAAPGFQQAVHKLSIIVQLLLGEIPERSLFRQPILKKALAPYLHITQAVRVGDLLQFRETMQEHSDIFKKDKTYTLILRLRHNVIKTGMRMISISYSKISMNDISSKLHLDGVEDAEYIASKAIRDGVIDASIDHQSSFMKSKEIGDVYATNEPQVAFHQRITYCLNLRNEAIKAMRFPPNAHKKQLQEIESEERDNLEDLSKELEDVDDDSF